MFQTSESCIKLHAVVVLELLLSEQCVCVCVCVCVCPLLQVCVCVCVCVCVSTAPGVCVCVSTAVVGLMDRALDLKPEVTQGCGFESRLRQEVHDCSPGAAQSAAHCSKCVHLDGLNAENTFHSSLYSV